MKHIIILGDGMADYRLSEIGNRTPLEAAKKPTIDYYAQNGTMGICKTIPDNLPAGSDVANLSVLGYAPEIYYTGRSPLEAFSIGVPMEKDDISFRSNLVTLSDEDNYEDKTMLDYSSDEITTEEARELINALKCELDTSLLMFFCGISYRHILLWKNEKNTFSLTPPHDISGRKITDYLPKGKNSETLLNLMKESHKILKNHPVNLKRIKRGLNPANSIWLWGCGTRPMLSDFYEKYKKHGTMISAVDLLKGIGKCANMRVVEVENATGNINTNFEGKAKAAIDALTNGSDFVFVHIEAPDECGHRGETLNKVKSIELIDEKVVKYIKEKLEALKLDYKIMITPDHATPISLKTHTHDTVPFVIFDSTNPLKGIDKYTEENAQNSGISIKSGAELMELFLN